MKERARFFENPFVSHLEKAGRLVAAVALAFTTNTYLVSTSVAEAAGSEPHILFYCTRPGENPVYVASDSIKGYVGKSYVGQQPWECNPTRQIP
jgi:hypothetical protein